MLMFLGKIFEGCPLFLHLIELKNNAEFPA